MKRTLYIVARHEKKLYNKFAKAYAGAPDVQVLYDRREKPRRNRLEVRTDERRRGDRRWHDVTRSLRTVGWAMVRQI